MGEKVSEKSSVHKNGSPAHHVNSTTCRILGWRQTKIQVFHYNRSIPLIHNNLCIGSSLADTTEGNRGLQTEKNKLIKRQIDSRWHNWRIKGKW